MNDCIFMADVVYVARPCSIGRDRRQSKRRYVHTMTGNTGKSMMASQGRILFFFPFERSNCVAHVYSHLSNCTKTSLASLAYTLILRDFWTKRAA